jgi:hypothetical protein
VRHEYLYKVSLCRADAPTLEPEFPEVAGAASVRFLPSGCVASLRIAHDLDEPQRQILQAVDGGMNASLPESAFRSIPMRLTERCAMIRVI